MPDLRQFTISIDTPDGTVGPARITVSDEPTRLADIVPAIHEIASGAVALAIDREKRNGKAISCKAGCGVCCCQLVPLAAAEVFYLVNTLLAMPQPDRVTVLRRFEAIEQAIEKPGVLQRIRSLGETADNNAVAREYFELHLPCPFLENEACSIHPIRPIACREYNVTSSPDRCTNPFHFQVDTVPLHRRISAGLSRFCASYAGLPPGLVPMPLIFDYYEANKAIAQKTWNGVELFEAALDAVCGKSA